MSGMEHAIRVAATFGVDEPEYLIAIFHDFLEDKIGAVPYEVFESVEVLTRRTDESYADYISRVADSGDHAAIRVKIADLRDNIERCQGLHGGIVRPTRRKRYMRALATLTASATGRGAQAAPTQKPGPGV